MPTILLCLVLQAVFTFWCVRYYSERSHREANAERPFIQIRSLLLVMVVLMLGNFLQIMIWGSLFMALGEFKELYEAVYHSAVNFSSLGYGDVVMTRPWKLLGPRGGERGIDVRPDRRRVDGDPATDGQDGRKGRVALE